MGVQRILSRRNVAKGLRMTQKPGMGSFRKVVAYPRKVTTTEVDSDFAESAGLRIEQAFALCSFAAELVGKARQ
jgi:hypothetical protein